MKTARLKEFLERQYRLYHRPEYLRLDPLICIRHFSFPADLETAGLVASALAYGRAETIIRNVSDILDRIGTSPAAFATGTTIEEKQRLLRNFKHRFNDGGDIALLLQAAGSIVERHGSLESYFLGRLDPAAPSVKDALCSFVAGIRRQARRIEPNMSRSFDFLLPSPASGSACKRLNMYLRWMVRKNDGIDHGVWKRVPPAKLVMPVDTHVARIARRLKLSRRPAADWTMAEEITARLRVCDPFDPVKYDFSLCRSGMIDFRREAA
jgi:uncharacterized protein (TIGR02757 family)